MDKDNLMSAYAMARYNRQMMGSGSKCGCFYCLKIFASSEIDEWCSETENGEGVTAICPYCGVDAIISENCEFPLTSELLGAMNKMWFCE